MAQPTATPQNGAPPSIYSQQGQMMAQQSSGPGTSPADQAATAGTSGGNDKDTQNYVDTITKLIALLGSIGSMKPKGQDITKYTQAAADALKEGFKQVMGVDFDSSMVPGTTPTADQTVGAPPDLGTGSGGAGGGAAAA